MGCVVRFVYSCAVIEDSIIAETTTALILTIHCSLLKTYKYSVRGLCIGVKFVIY